MYLLAPCRTKVSPSRTPKVSSDDDDDGNRDDGDGGDEATLLNAGVPGRF